MVFHRSFDGALHDGSKLHSQALCSLRQLCGEGVSDGANEMDGKPRTAILLDVAYEEISEALNQKFVYLGYLAMFREERGEAGKESVSQGLAIHLFEDYLLGKSIFGQELLFDSFGELVLEAIAYKAAAEYGATALVAEDIAQWRSVGNNLLSIVETGIRPRAEYTGNAFFVTTEGTCSS